MASKKLCAIANDIDQDKTGRHCFSMVITKNQVARRDENGIYIVPLGCLKN
ncbi:MAG: hypothetical protein HUJ60_00205 [Bacilli bacterium]|nr:hypothetical protein [Bacilli bacterium]